MAIPKQIFKTYDIRGIVGEELTPERITAIGHAFGIVLGGEEARRTVAIGRDMRASSEVFAKAMRDGLERAGCATVDLGLVTTPMLNYYVGVHGEIDGGVMITASHNPSEWNGLKMCYGDVRPVGGQTGLQEIYERIVEERLPVVERQVEHREEAGWPEAYMELLVPEQHEPTGMRVAVDTGNGMVGAFIEAFAARLGIELVPLCLPLDDTFPNHEANPLKVETLQMLQETVREQGLDLGIAFDADGDRIGAVDDRGEVIAGDRLGLLIAKHLLQSKDGATVLADVRCSRDVVRAVGEAGGKVSLCPVGHALIKEQMRREGAVFAIELSAHFYFADRYYVESALRAMALILAVVQSAGQPLSTLVQEDTTMVASGEVNFHVQDKVAMMEEVRDWCQEQGLELTDLDGVRADAEDWWVSLRASNTEPVLRLNVEAANATLLEERVTFFIDRITTSEHGGEGE